MASLGDRRVTNLRSRTAWGVLASLALDPETASVSRLGLRFWPDSPDPAGNLRTVLAILRDALGEGVFERSRGSVWLKPGAVTTDLGEMRRLHADALLATHDASSRADLLRRAALVHRGPFLDGVDPPAAAGDDPWLERMRQEAEALAADVWLRLAGAMETVGERREAFDAAGKALALTPESSEAQELALRLADSAPERASVRRLADRYDLEELLVRLDALDGQGLAPTVREEQVLDAALARCFGELRPRLAQICRRLTVFPASFTASQANAIAGADAETLAELAARSLVRCPPPPDGKRFSLAPAVRGRLFARLHTRQVQRLRERHARHYATNEGRPQGPFGHDPDCMAWTRGEREHLLLASETLASGPLTEESYWLLHNLCILTQGVPPVHREVLGRAAPFFRRAADEAKPYPPAYAASLLIQHYTVEENFAEALHWAKAGVDHFRTAPPLPPSDVPYFSAHTTPEGKIYALAHEFVGLLTAAHHAGADADFDAGIESAWRLCPLPDMDPTRDVDYRRQLHYLQAENCLARKRWAEGLSANARAGEALEEVIALLPFAQCYRSAHFYQRACLSYGAGDRDAALRDWDRALTGFQEDGERHGMGDCLQGMGAACADVGLFGQARAQVEQALSLYESTGDRASRAACRGTLGDVYLKMGRPEKARRLYHQGLTYWRRRGHERWVARFTERIALLEAGEREAAHVNSAPPGGGNDSDNERGD